MFLSQMKEIIKGSECIILIIWIIHIVEFNLIDEEYSA